MLLAFFIMDYIDEYRGSKDGMIIPFKSKDEVKNNFYKGANRSVAYGIRKGLIKPYRESVEEIIKKTNDRKNNSRTILSRSRRGSNC